jgi:hypothetical protein
MNLMFIAFAATVQPVRRLAPMSGFGRFHL